MIRDINDPEHPYTLEQLKVLTLEGIEADDAGSHVSVHFTPTIPHCSMSSLIGLCIRVRLERSLPPRFKIDVNVTPGSHESEQQCCVYHCFEAGQGLMFFFFFATQ